MKSNSDWLVILNPASGNGILKNKNERIHSELSGLNHPYSIQYTNYSGHEIELVKQGIENGYRKFISVGGDGTLHQIVNGVMRFGKELLHEIKVGVIPIGTGNDWIKQYNIPKNVKRAIEILNREQVVSQDIGRITIQGEEHYFNNLMGMGFDGLVVSALSKYKKFGSASYFLSALEGIFKYKSKELEAISEGRNFKGKTFILVVGICEFCGGGMRLTHEPNASDGLLDVTLIKDISKLSFLWHLRKMYNGKLHLHPKVDSFKTKELTIAFEGKDKPFMQVDGELVEMDKMKVDLIPKAINFII